jgi:hypothetical protein
MLDGVFPRRNVCVHGLGTHHLVEYCTQSPFSVVGSDTLRNYADWLRVVQFVRGRR